MSEGSEEDIARDIDQRMERAEEADDAERLKTLEEVKESLEAELDEGGETQPPGR